MQTIRNAFASQRPQAALGFDPSYGAPAAAQRLEAPSHEVAKATRTPAHLAAAAVDQYQSTARAAPGAGYAPAGAIGPVADGTDKTQTSGVEPMAWRLPPAGPEQQPPQNAPQGMDTVQGLVGVIANLVGILGQLLKGRGLPGRRPADRHTQPRQHPQADRREAFRARLESMRGKFSGRFSALAERARSSGMSSAAGRHDASQTMQISAGKISGSIGKSKGSSKGSNLGAAMAKTEAQQNAQKNSLGGRIKAARKKSGNNSPLALDINGQKGIQTSEKKVNFDIDGDGKLDHVNDVKEGVLAFGAGKNGKQLFGNNTDLDGDGKADGYKNGFEALRALAKKEGMYNEKAGDTKLDAKDLAMLEKKYHFGLKQGYHAQTESLAKHGVTEIELGSETARTTMRQGDQKDVTLQKQVGATFKHNGQTKEYVDVWHRT